MRDIMILLYILCGNWNLHKLCSAVNRTFYATYKIVLEEHKDSYSNML